MAVPPHLDNRLREYAASVPESKGTLSLFLVVTDHARARGLPLDADRLVADGGGQVRRLGRPAVQRILARHGINEVLAREGGRTSMGSVPRMRGYVDLLNRLHEEGLAADPDAIEAFWIAKVRDHLARRRTAPPAAASGRRKSRRRLTLDRTRSPRNMFLDLFCQAEDRDSDYRRTYSGAVLAHLAAATLDLTLSADPPESGNDTPDHGPQSLPYRLLLGDTVIYLDASPGETTISACRESLERGNGAVLVTVPRRVSATAVMAEDAGLGEQLDVFDIAHFLAVQLYLRSRFHTNGFPAELRRLVATYNGLVDRAEADQSLKIRYPGFP